jgi:hypothetical protein
MNSRNLTSSSLRVTVAPASLAASRARTARMPGRRGYRTRRSRSERLSVSRFVSASFIALSSWRGRSTVARSNRVRGTVVTGIPSRYVISSGASRVTCSAMPAASRRCLGAVTSIPASAAIPQSAAAGRWLRTAPGPLARTAASHRPSLQRVVTHGVHRPVDGLKSTAPQAKVDGVGLSAQLQQLPAGHHAVLAPREGDGGPVERRAVEIINLTFAAYVAVNVRRIGHAAQFGPRRVTGGLRKLRPCCGFRGRGGARGSGDRPRRREHEPPRGRRRPARSEQGAQRERGEQRGEPEADHGFDLIAVFGEGAVQAL